MWGSEPPSPPAHRWRAWERVGESDDRVPLLLPQTRGTAHVPFTFPRGSLKVGAERWLKLCRHSCPWEAEPPSPPASKQL